MASTAGAEILRCGLAEHEFKGDVAAAAYKVFAAKADRMVQLDGAGYFTECLMERLRSKPSRDLGQARQALKREKAMWQLENSPQGLRSLDGGEEPLATPSIQAPLPSPAQGQDAPMPDPDPERWTRVAGSMRTLLAQLRTRS